MRWRQNYNCCRAALGGALVTTINQQFCPALVLTVHFKMHTWNFCSMQSYRLITIMWI
jgi:hypothetical protein